MGWQDDPVAPVKPAWASDPVKAPAEQEKMGAPLAALASITHPAVTAALHQTMPHAEHARNNSHPGIRISLAEGGDVRGG